MRRAAAILVALITAYLSMAPAMSSPAVQLSPLQAWWDWVPWEPVVGLSHDFDGDLIPDTVDTDPTGTCDNTFPSGVTEATVVNWSNPSTPNPDLDALTLAETTKQKWCITEGDYLLSANINVQSDEWFQGRIDTAKGRPEIYTAGDVGNTSSDFGGVDRIFPVESNTNVQIKGLDIAGAQAWKTSAAAGCNPNCGRAISGGADMIVDDVRLHHNEAAGLAGSHNGDWTITDSEIDNNGFGDIDRPNCTTPGECSYFAQDGDENAAGVKTASNNAGANTFTNLHVHDNSWAGLWCDLDCGDFDIADSTITNNGRNGIHYEVSAQTSSDHATFSNNVIQDNGLGPAGDSSYLWGHQAGIMITTSSYVTVTGNTFGGNAPELTLATLPSQYDNAAPLGVDVWNDSGRQSGINDGLGLHDVTVSGNTMNGDKVLCDNRTNVTCQDDIIP
jgi:hypothetical protein